MNIAIERGIDLWIGQGPYRLRLAFHGWGFFLFRVPFLGKAWAYGSGGSGSMGWAEAKQEAIAYGDD